jgi:hypothetical protein
MQTFKQNDRTELLLHKILAVPEQLCPGTDFMQTSRAGRNSVYYWDFNVCPIIDIKLNRVLAEKI